MLTEPYFQLPYPKSTGRELFNLEWLQKSLTEFSEKISPVDVQTTLCELTAISILQAINDLNLKKANILVCGGGIYNNYLINRLRIEGNHSIYSTADFGIAPDWIEAMTFAWLAQQTLTRKPGNLPSVTGAKNYVVLGGIYLNR